MLKKIIALSLVLIIFASAFALVPAVEAEQPVELPIIMYHHILKDHSRWGKYIISPDTLEGDMKYLKEKGYTSVSVEELVAFSCGNGKLPEKPVLITFDDGQESVISYGLPILEKYDMKAVLLIVGAYADRYTESPDHNIAYSYLSWPDIADLSGSEYIEFGIHTYDMHSCGTGRRGCAIMPGEEENDYNIRFTEDISKVENRFNEYVGSIPRIFAYPFGIWSDQTQGILTDRGYEVILTCDEHVNVLTGDPSELLSLGRFNRSNDVDRNVFFAKLGLK